MSAMGRFRTLRSLSIPLSYSPLPVLASSSTQRRKALLRLSRTRRPSRQGEWNERNAVTFIVTLAAQRNVTLAARAAGMSRKAAYALRNRNSDFAAAWEAAYRAGSRMDRRPAPRLPVGDKGNELHNPPVRTPHRNSATLPQDFSWFYETLAKWRGESALPPLASASTLP